MRLAETIEVAYPDDAGAPKILEMERKVWLSRADVCALLRARSLLDLLRDRLPDGEAEETMARILSLRSFRSSVREACFRSDDARDHVLLTVSEDIYAVLRAMGLCGEKDSRGRQICITSFIRRAWDEWNNMGPRTLSIYRVLLEQYGLIFGLETGTAMNWDRTRTINYAALLFGKWEESVRRDIAVLSKSTDESSNGPPTWTERARNFFDAACSLETTLEEAVSWRLETQDKPRDLAAFRSRAECPTSQERASHAARLPNETCRKIVAAHARLYAARLAESAVMQALSLLKNAGNARSMAQGLCTLLSSKPTPNACDFRKMRLTWRNEKGEWRYVGTIQAYCQTGPRSADVHLGLSSATQWIGADGRPHPIQDELTRKTVELSRRSLMHQGELNVLSKEVLDIETERSNPAFDLKYREALKPWAPPAKRDPCTEVAAPMDIMVRALALWWSRRGEPQYPSALKKVIVGHVSPAEEALKGCTVAASLKSSLKNVVEHLNLFVKKYSFKTSNLHRDIELVLIEEHAPPWTLPLTMEKTQSVGIYYFVVWMLCHDRVLAANKMELRGRFLMDNKEVPGSAFTQEISRMTR